MKEVGTMIFQMALGGSLEVAEVLYVLGRKTNLLSISSLEDARYDVEFQNRQVFIHLEGATQDIAISLGVKNGKLYNLQSHPISRSKGILDHGLMLVIEIEQKALKTKLIARTQRSNLLYGQEASSKSVRTSWYDLTLMDAQEQDPRSMVGRNRSSNQTPK